MDFFFQWTFFFKKTLNSVVCRHLTLRARTWWLCRSFTTVPVENSSPSSPHLHSRPAAVSRSIGSPSRNCSSRRYSGPGSRGFGTSPEVLVVVFFAGSSMSSYWLLWSAAVGIVVVLLPILTARELFGTRTPSLDMTSNICVEFTTSIDGKWS